MATKATRKRKAKFEEWREPFLEALRQYGVVTYAAEQAGVTRPETYKARERNAEFAAEWDAAMEEATDRLEKEAQRRAVEGVRRLKFAYGAPIMVPLLDEEGIPVKDEKGEVVMVPYIEREYSDTLLIFLLKGNRPQKYRENVDVTSGGEKITINVKLSED
jgi:hypothetical protein